MSNQERSSRRRRSRLDDVAAAAGVSVATVDRALNNRPGVRAETRAHIAQIASALGYRPDPAASTLARRTALRFVFILPDPSNSFFEQMHAGAAEAVDWLRPQGVWAEIREVDRFNVSMLAKVVCDAAREADGLVIRAVDDPLVRDAINEVTANGVPVVTLVSDCPGSRRCGFAGIDNVAAGRTAGALIGRFLGGRPGEVAIIVGLQRIRDHAERVLGLRQVIEPNYPTLNLLPEREGRDVAAENERALSQVLAERPNIVAVYNVAAGNRGVIAALKKSGRAGDIIFVGHELTWVTRAALIDGTMHATIAQDISHEIRSAARQLLAHVANEPLIPAQERIRIEIYLRENLP